MDNSRDTRSRENRETGIQQNTNDNEGKKGKIKSRKRINEAKKRGDEGKPIIFL